MAPCYSKGYSIVEHILKRAPFDQWSTPVPSLPVIQRDEYLRGWNLPFRGTGAHAAKEHDRLPAQQDPIAGDILLGKCDGCQ